jgi:Zn finger protein HypA/HybF involved in hydrogenase expression
MERIMARDWSKAWAKCLDCNWEGVPNDLLENPDNFNMELCPNCQSLEVLINAPMRVVS